MVHLTNRAFVPYCRPRISLKVLKMEVGMSYQNQSDSNHFSKIIELQFEIGGFHQGHNRLILKGNKISVLGFEVNGTPFTHIPFVEKWLEFTQNLEQLKIWDWKQRYESNILDGTQWSLLIRTAYSEINCSGSNAFPPDFNKFITSINKLINLNYFDTKSMQTY